MTNQDIATINQQIENFKATGQAETGLDQSVLKIANYYTSQKDINTAENYFNEALKISNTLHENNTAVGLGLKNAFAVALTGSGCFEKSEHLLSEVIKEFQTLYPNHKANLIALRINYLNAKMKQDKYEGIEHEIEELLDLNKKHNTGDAHHRVLLEYYRKYLYRIDNYKRAYDIGKKHLALCRKELGDNHKLTAFSLDALGDICYYGAIGKSEGAFFYKEALNYFSSKEGYNFYQINSIKHSLGRFYRDVLFDSKTALDYFLQVIKAYQAEDRQDEFNYIDALLSAAALLVKDNKVKKAKQYLDDASDIINKSRKPYIGSKAKLNHHYSIYFTALNNKPEAISFAEQALKLQTEHKRINNSSSQNYLKSLESLDASNSYLLSLKEGVLESVKLNQSAYQKFLDEELYDDSKKRSIRVFISSTFKDMMNEREYLMKKVFPQFRKMCRERGVDFTEVDLRWGITEEDALKGKVIEICLNEIDRSRPYFIGILGERYGWIPDNEEYSNYTQIFENYDWVKDDLAHELSITEMEIQYGVIRNPNMDGRAFFYIRNKKLTPEGNENKERLDSKEYKKLKQLKKYLREQDDYPVHDFDSIEALGKSILEDLVNKVLNDFELTDFNEHQKKRLEQISFLKTFLPGFVGQEDYLAKLDKLIDSGPNKLIITGEQGIGKTALVAKWLHINIAKNKDTYYLFHFLEASSDSSEYRIVLKRLLEEIKLHTGTSFPVKANPGNPSKEFTKFLATFNPKEKVVIVIDGADRIIHDNFFAKFNWLPSKIPDNVSIIITTRKGEERSVLLDTGFSELEVLPFKKEPRFKFIEDYLSGFGKALPEKLTNQIAEDNISSSPLALRALLDELRVFGVHEKLQEHLNRFLKANGPIELFEEILDRIEEDYGIDKPEAIGETLAIIAVSRGGMREKELMELTNIAQMQWSPIYTSLESYFTNNNGILKLSNDFLKKAIENKYLNATIKKELHSRLASFFSKLESAQRKYAELGYHLFQSDDKEGLKNFLTDLEIFNLYAHDKLNEFFAYWESLADKYSLTEEYRNAFLEAEKANRYTPVELSQIALNLAKYAAQFYKKDAEFFFLDRAYEINKKYLGEDTPETIEILNSLGNHFLRHQDNESAKKYIKLVVDWLEKNPQLITLQKIGSYSNLAHIKIEENKLNDAEELFEKALMKTEKIAGKQTLASVPILMDQSKLYKIQNEYNKALDILMETLKINKQFAGDNNFSTALNYQALAELSFEVKNYQKAKDFCDAAIYIFEKTVGEKSTHLIGPLRLYGYAEYLLNNYESAIDYLVEALMLGFELMEEDQGIPFKREIADVLVKIGTAQNNDEVISYTNDIYERIKPYNS